MREVNSKEIVVVKPRKHQRYYNVKFASAEKPRRFEHLSDARDYARNFIGQDVEITNKNGIPLPL